MFREMRRGGQRLPEEECIRILSEATSGVLAVHGDGGYPYAVPLSFVYDGGRIYFHCASVGHKLDSIKADSRVSFCVTAQDDVVPETYSTDYRSVIVFGRAHIIEDSAEKRDAIVKLALKYAPDNSQAHMESEINDSFDHLTVVEITVEHMTGKESLALMKKRRS